MNSLRRSLTSAQTDHQMALERVAVAEAQLQQAVQDSQEQVSNYSQTTLEKFPTEEAHILFNLGHQPSN